MEVNCLRNLALKVFNTLNNLKCEFMEEIFCKTTILTHSLLHVTVN